MSLITKIKLILEKIKPFQTPDSIKLQQEILGKLNYEERKRKDYHK
jgi:hypothetical protein